MASLYAITQENDAAIAQRLSQVAESKGVTRAEVALAWLLSKTAVTAPIIGASRAEQFEDRVKAVDATLSEEEVALLEEVSPPHQAVGFE